MAAQATYDLVLHKNADPRTGGVAICGFSTVGMVGVIAASHVISPQFRISGHGSSPS
jgi:predicted ATP-grasp superfamily ATP-dependent carboligase